MNIDIFQLFFNYLKERPYNNILQNVRQDADYLEAMILENKLKDQYQQLDLLNEQRKIITVDRCHSSTGIRLYGCCFSNGHAILLFLANTTD